jgi:vacuolar-type H+-ATPase subunit H
MGFLDDAKKKAEELAEQHPDQVEKLSDGAIAKAGGLIDGATGGKYDDQIKAAEKKADDAIGS